MALRPTLVSKHNSPFHSLTLINSNHPRVVPEKVLVQSNTNRRVAIAAAMASFLLAKEATFGEQFARGLDFRMAEPGQTLVEAARGVRYHAQALLEVKGLMETQSWGEAQKKLRKSSSLLKQDIYTIIQGKAGSERPELRKLYAVLFNNVSKLDYAARDKDASRAWQSYDNIVLALNEILSRI